MLEKTVKWRREFKPEQLSPDATSKEVNILHKIAKKKKCCLIDIYKCRLRLVKCTLMVTIRWVDLFGL